LSTTRETTSLQRSLDGAGRAGTEGSFARCCLRF
jgi:hypothetical protein